MRSTYTVKSLVAITVLTVILSGVSWAISSSYERDDGPTLGFGQELKPPSSERQVTGRNCDLVLYIAGHEKAQGWPYVTKKTSSDTFCGAYPDQYYPDSKRANVAIIIIGSGVLSLLGYLIGSRIIRTKKEAK